MEYNFMTKYDASDKRDRAKDVAMQRRIIARADYSLAILGMGCVYRGSGRFLNIRVQRKQSQRSMCSIDDHL